MPKYDLDDVRDFLDLKDNYSSKMRTLMGQLNFSSHQNAINNHLKNVHNERAFSSNLTKTHNQLNKIRQDLLTNILEIQNQSHIKSNIEYVTAMILFLGFFKNEANLCASLEIVMHYLSQNHYYNKVDRLVDLDVLFFDVFNHQLRYKTMSLIMSNAISDEVLVKKTAETSYPEWPSEVDPTKFELSKEFMTEINLQDTHNIPDSFIQRIKKSLKKNLLPLAVKEETINKYIDQIVNGGYVFNIHAKKNNSDQIKAQILQILVNGAKQLTVMREENDVYTESLIEFHKNLLQHKINHLVDETTYDDHMGFASEDISANKRRRLNIITVANRIMQICAPKYVIGKLAVVPHFFSQMQQRDRFKYLEIIKERQRIKKGLCIWTWHIKWLVAALSVMTILCFLTPIVINIFKVELNLSFLTRMATVQSVIVIAMVFTLRVLMDKQKRSLRQVNENINQLFNAVESNSMGAKMAVTQAKNPLVENRSYESFMSLR
ncbi:MAG: hypothetical protein ACON5A_04505 [Candidatus Comchoanobacterales bacterium]